MVTSVDLKTYITDLHLCHFYVAQNIKYFNINFARL
jgi:hypothetical protein